MTLAGPDGATDVGPQPRTPYVETASPEPHEPEDPDEPGEPDWVSDLSSSGPRHEEALRRLHALLLKAARHQVWRMRDQLPGVGAVTVDELATCAADDALVAILAKLGGFEGRSRFTTWAYKFAILQAANEVRRHAWSSREVCLPDDALWSDASAGPEQHAEATDLAAAVQHAMAVALTSYQRRIALALLVEQVPIDVLADRLGTTRGALYKTLHVARSRLRAHLTASGHLTTARGGTP
ncbi:RNA polymerase subunit sigma24 [Intrasporangium oryzae NRRL B-24470]|uniref:RNA polymerase subunit sigma24 n=1 Tax=Intrasporangium oryzae NRRL B-24470 TaxID=1386089 RepID=W9GCD4_9MICO|nr:sigma-70 family RNA polymerase sigma factor [Intrasporangium oryzae]EWT01489.1 RNA polymerase subunit sigma24 [Intrasporangium oryzae NRRL B-24470]